MRQGIEPNEACLQVIKRIHKRLGTPKMFEMALIAVDVKGRYGACGSFASWTDDVTRQVYNGMDAVWLRSVAHSYG